MISIDPNLEYMDGTLVGPHAGDWLHSLVQSNVLFALRQRYPHLRVVTGLSSRVSPTRFRLPDVSVLLAAPNSRYLHEAAFLVVEVLSDGDVMSVVLEKLKEYASAGVTNVWLIDPRLRLVYTYQSPNLIGIEADTISTLDGAIELRRAEIFAE